MEDHNTCGKVVRERALSAMPMLIKHCAYVFGTYRRAERDGEPVFQRLLPPVIADYPQVEERDAFELRDFFLSVGNPVEALHFLREAGSFDINDSDITWTMFQRWQRYARALHIREERYAILESSEPLSISDTDYLALVETARRPRMPPCRTDKQSYLGPSPILQENEQEFNDSTQYLTASTETEEGLALKRLDLKRQIEEGKKTIAVRQRELEAQFIAPVSGTYEVIWNPEKPFIRFLPRCALEAIANAIQVDRLAGVRYTRCAKEQCSRILQVGDQKAKQYCDRKCMDAARKQRQRRRSAANSQKLQTATL